MSNGPTKPVVREEFQSCDFETIAEMIDFANRPFMAKLSRDVLEPLYLTYVKIREENFFPSTGPTRSQLRWIRTHVREYLYGALCEDQRIPTPRPSWIRSVMAAETIHGFEGDEDPLLRTVLRGKLASLLVYADLLRQRHYARLVEPAGVPSEDTSAPGSRMAAFPCNAVRTVDQLIQIPDILFAYLRVFQASTVEAIEYMDSKDAHLSYVTDHLRPYAAVINACIPSTVRRPSEMPEGRAQELAPYIVTFIEHCALLHGIALGYARSSGESPFLDSRVRWCFVLMDKFDMLSGRPNYGFSSATRSVFLGRASSASSLSLAGRVDGSAFDVPLSGEYLSLPAVPPWTEEDIGRLRAEEESYAWRLSATDLTALWIIRVRFLAAQLHHITTIARESETPPRTVDFIRSGIRELAKNMVDLGRASVEYGMDRGTRNDARFFVPGEATALFAMIERFIDSYGYLEDDLTPNRGGVVRPSWKREWYALRGTLKAHQVAMLRATHVEKRKFGDNLRRYNLDADPGRWYDFPNPTLALVPTRPNTS
ncbi:hypothetical protein DFH06DRAFT_1154013 [Mycena polygramma]|nr:hypothetical protein DFH06DRAFT_1154013 [Mycena polygramma]